MSGAQGMVPVTRFTVRSPRLPAEFDGSRIVQLTDLHGRRFGTDNAQLAATIRALHPFLVVMTGDMVNCIGDDGEPLLALARGLTAEYPVYYVDGNHEIVRARHQPGDTTRLMERLGSLGVVRLENGCRRISRGAGHVAVCGLDLPIEYYLPFFDRRSRRSLSLSEMTGRLGSAPEDFTILLAHSPFYFAAYAGWGTDLTFAGHLHGGMVRLPLVGGVLSPDWTLFPRYAAGCFQRPRAGGGQSVMVVSRGLGSNHRPRIGNPPEVVCVTLAKE